MKYGFIKVAAASPALRVADCPYNAAQTVAAMRRGAGERVMHTMMSLAEGEPIRLEVASTNRRAIRLYERLGFVTVGEKSRWYCL